MLKKLKQKQKNLTLKTINYGLTTYYFSFSYFMKLDHTGWLLYHNSTYKYIDKHNG